MVKTAVTKNKGANKENVSPQDKKAAEAKRKRDARAQKFKEGMSKPEKRRLIGERDYYIEKSRIAVRKLQDYKKLWIESNKKYDRREELYTFSYDRLSKRLDDVKADNFCISDSCTDKFL